MEESVEVYTTRPDTIMGVSFLALSTNHALAICASESNSSIQKFIEDQKKSKVAERILAYYQKNL